MSQEKLIDLHAGKGLEAGLYPSAEPASGQTWSGGKNAWFRELSVEQTLGFSKILSVTGRPSQSLAQAFNSPNKSLYYENLGIIYQLNGVGSPTVFGAPTIIGALSSMGDIVMEPWGTWLLATDGISQPGIWLGAGVGFTPIGIGQFKTAAIIKKLAQFAVAYNTDTQPSGFYWTDVSNPQQWTPALNNAARNLNIRGLDSEIVCVTDLGASHGVYSRDNLLLVQYVGPNSGWLGTPNQAITGIGAVSKRSVVAVGNLNFGLSRNGIFQTDGNTATYIDRPALDKWIQENIDFTLATTIAGYWNERLGLVVWNVPLLSSSAYYSASTTRLSIGLDPKIRTVSAESIYLSRKTFTFLDGGPTFGLQREVFDNLITVRPDGLYYESVPATLNGTFNLQSQLFDGGDHGIFKLWDYAIFPGRFGSDIQVNFGFTNTPDLSTVIWNGWQPMSYQVPIAGGPQEAVFSSIQFQGTSLFKLSAMMVYGEKGGFVN